MTIKQLSVFLENREGRLDEVLRVLGENDVLSELKGRRIRAGSVELKPGNCAFIVM